MPLIKIEGKPEKVQHAVKEHHWSWGIQDTGNVENMDCGKKNRLYI
jgi:hypothetical protein